MGQRPGHAVALKAVTILPPGIYKALTKKDPQLGKVLSRIEKFPSFPLPSQKRTSYFRYLGRAIVYQQLAGKAAQTIHGRVCALTSGPHFPDPAAVLKLSDQKLRGAGLSQAKMLAVQDLSRNALAGTLKLRSLWRLADDEIIERLVQVRGIGEWTAQMFLIFRLGRLDVMPSGDLGVQEGLRLLDGLNERPKPKDLAARTECWAPYRSVGAWAMWRLADGAGA